MVTPTEELQRAKPWAQEMLHRGGTEPVRVYVPTLEQMIALNNSTARLEPGHESIRIYTAGTQDNFGTEKFLSGNGIEYQHNEDRSEYLVTGFLDIRKLAEAGLKFEGADILRSQEARLRHEAGTSRTQRPRV